MSKDWQDEIRFLKTRVDAAKDELDDALRRAVEEGRSYTVLGRLLGQSEGAVRIKARRKHWDTNRRRSRA